ncbi:MAG TPA: hypothetical protein VGM90_37375 [Kofleriaceae bacterium]|jgi:hypothetical protein
MRWACLAGLLAACGTSSEPPPTPDVFLAFSSSFADFRSWNFFHSDGPPAGTQPDPVLGPRSQYINTIPPTGSTEFPVGTIIVEVRENGTNQILAGVKRGGDYNATGAINWEWFELTENPVTIAWRGVGPPAGETYGGDPNGGCNSCHAACGADNDYVCSAHLQLSGF